jgi:hypothetical protein
MESKKSYHIIEFTNEENNILIDLYIYNYSYETINKLRYINFIINANIYCDYVYNTIK